MTASASPSESRPKPITTRSENAVAAADRGVTIVIPTFNEAANIPELLRRISAAVPPGQETSVLFVDDSTDDTPEVIEKEAVRLPLEVSRTTEPTLWAAWEVLSWKASPSAAPGGSS